MARLTPAPPCFAGTCRNGNIVALPPAFADRSCAALTPQQPTVLPPPRHRTVPHLPPCGVCRARKAEYSSTSSSRVRDVSLPFRMHSNVLHPAHNAHPVSARVTHRICRGAQGCPVAFAGVRHEGGELMGGVPGQCLADEDTVDRQPQPLRHVWRGTQRVCDVAPTTLFPCRLHALCASHFGSVGTSIHVPSTPPSTRLCSL